MRGISNIGTTPNKKNEQRISRKTLDSQCTYPLPLCYLFILFASPQHCFGKTTISIIIFMIFKCFNFMVDFPGRERFRR